MMVGYFAGKAASYSYAEDERVRPSRRYKTKKGRKNGKPGFYNHAAMDGVEIPLPGRRM